MTTHTTTAAPRNHDADHPRGKARRRPRRPERRLRRPRRDPEALARFLAFRAHFHDYSLNNAVLIWCQRPVGAALHGLPRVAGARPAGAERGEGADHPRARHPQAGRGRYRSSDDDRAVVGYRTATVFDYEQTDAVADSALVYTPPAPRLNAEHPVGLSEALVAAAEALGYAVRLAETGYADGRCSFASRTITVQASLSPADRAAVLCHELARARARPEAARSDDPYKTTTAQRELQAEGAAFVALSALGLDTSRASLPYLEGWSGGDAEALRREMTAIDRISRELLARVGADTDESRPREGGME